MTAVKTSKQQEHTQTDLLKTILASVKELQTTVNGLQASVNNLQSNVNNVLALSKDLQDRLKRMEKTMAANQAALDSAIQSLVDSINKVGTDVLTAIDDLQAKIASGQDFTGEINSLTNAGQALANLDAQVVAADPGATSAALAAAAKA